MADDFSVNLLKAIAAQNYYLCGLQTARELFGKSYFSLGLSEKAAVDQATLAMVGGNYLMLTPEFLSQQKAQSTVGFQTQQGTEAPKKS